MVPAQTAVVADHADAPGVEPTTIVFPEGLPGFEACRRFTVQASEALAPLKRLQALDGPAASFLALDPRLVVADYPARLNASDGVKLQADGATPLVWLAIVAVEADGSATVNLRAPVVVNPARMIGRQVVCDDPSYGIRHPIFVPGA